MEDTEGLIRRFIEIRKNNGPTQAKFGKLLGLSDGTISTIEAGTRPLTEKHIKLVCGTLGINETWLKTGEGPVFTEEIPGQKRLLDAFRQLSPKGREMAINVIETILKTQLEQAWNEGVGNPINWEKMSDTAWPEAAPKQSPGGAREPLEALQEAKTEINPIHKKKRS